MKKPLLLLTLTAFGLAGFAQTFVSTTPENRNVVLEEFTGIYCGYCPDGHLRAQQLYDANPGDVVVVNVHTGGYANPDPGHPDFRTDFGSALGNQSGVCGYPAGTVNREYFSGYEQTNASPPCTSSTAQGRGSWNITGGMVLSESSSVNVAGQADLDLSTRELTVVVEAYYTGNAVNATNKLTVAVLENNVEGPQSGSSQNPTQVLPNGNYNHQHMLRHFMDGQWGTTISSTSTGSFFTQTYTWTVPTEHNGVPIKLNDLEVAVYVAEGNEDIISGNEVDLSIASPNAYDALPLEIDLPEFVCGNEVTPKVTIQNMGNETMTSLLIRYNINGGPIQTYNWTGSLATAGSEEVTLPAMTFNHLSTNTFWVSTSSPNGQTDQVTSNNNSTKTFQPSKNSGTTIDLEIVTDDYGYETYWEIQDANGTTVASGGNTNVGINGGGAETAGTGDPGAYGANTTITEQVTLSGTGCHTFVIVDDYADGICCSYGDGSFTIESGGTTLYTGGEYASSDTRTFDVGGTNGIDNLELLSGLNVYPNPFTNEALVNYNLVEKADVSLRVYNVLGATVIAENFGEKAAGAHTFTLSSDGLQAGVYMVNLLVGDTNHSTRVTISK